jgi:hypothetical protein
MKVCLVTILQLIWNKQLIMIRRNHTQAVPKTNFADCSLRPRQPYEDTSQAKRQTCKLEL